MRNWVLEKKVEVYELTGLKDAEYQTGIITAKHNLCVNSDLETPLEWDEEQAAALVGKFLDGLKVGYNVLVIEQTPLNEQFLYPANSAITDLVIFTGFFEVIVAERIW